MERSPANRRLRHVGRVLGGAGSSSSAAEARILGAGWPRGRSAEQWLAEQPLEEMKAKFARDGYIVAENIVLPAEGLGIYRDSVDAMWSGEIDCADWRHDLGAHTDPVVEDTENTGQIMWPCDRVAGLGEGPFHERSALLAKVLLGDDVRFDFDMLIWKDALTETETPWHQDEAYWPAGMEDKRAMTSWMALDDVSVENGCMWFVPATHAADAIRKHRPASAGSHVLTTDDIGEAEGHPVPLKSGSAVIWHGRSLHYAGPNTTDAIRRTYIANYRPETMIQFERENGFDHLRTGFDNHDPLTAGDAYKEQEELPDYDRGRAVAEKKRAS